MTREKQARDKLRLSAMCRAFCVGGSILTLSGCATAPLDRAGTLASYENLTPTSDLLTKSQIRLNADYVLAARTVRVIPTDFSNTIADATLTEGQRRMIANAADRSLCVGLSERFRIAAPGQPADLTVRAVVTHVGRTDAMLAGVSKVASLATSVFVPLEVPVPKPRIPFGLGSLSLEAEAQDASGVQQAAMIWGRGADAFLSSPKVSTAGDAFDLASSFGTDFSKMLVTGSDPFKGVLTLPSLQRINASLGGAPRGTACEAFGRGPGVPGLIAGALGLPPEWTSIPAEAGGTP